MLPRRLIFLPIVPSLLILIGTVGYHLVEGIDLFQSLYLAVVTLTTVGYGDIVPMTRAGQVFTIFLAMGGIFVMFYAAIEVVRLVVSGEVHAALGRRRMEQNLARLHDHLIVCGFGRMGRLVCQEFSKERLPFVVIDRQSEVLADFQMAHGIPLFGDATSDDILRRAGIDRARALVTVATSDADNLYITMSARLLNDKLFIVARAESAHAEQKLLRAGASRVVSPYVIGGVRVAQAVLRPAVVDFIELATRTEHLELQIEETQVARQSCLVGTTIQDCQLRRDLGVIVVAIKKSPGHMVFNPSPQTVLEQGDTLIAVGHRQQLDQLEKLASGT